jgi:hypothetical protein
MEWNGMGWNGVIEGREAIVMRQWENNDNINDQNRRDVVGEPALGTTGASG